MSHMTPATAATLADTLHGRVVDHFGDTRVLVGADIIYCGITGRIKVDRRGRVIELGGLSDGAESIAAAYRLAVRGVSA